VQKPEEESKAKVEGKTNASENKDLGRRRCRRRARSAALRSCHLEIAAALSAACSDLRSSEERRDLFSGVVRACVGAIVEYKCGRCRSTFGLREVAGRIRCGVGARGCKIKGREKYNTLLEGMAPNNLIFIKRETPRRPFLRSFQVGYGQSDVLHSLRLQTEQLTEEVGAVSQVASPPVSRHCFLLGREWGRTQKREVGTALERLHLDHEGPLHATCHRCMAHGNARGAAVVGRRTGRRGTVSRPVWCGGERGARRRGCAVLVRSAERR
jgi:hypothetical protein